MRAELLKWRVQARNAVKFKWQNHGLFETQKAALSEAQRIRKTRRLAGLPWRGLVKVVRRETVLPK